jgi:hypothetical protein
LSGLQDGDEVVPPHEDDRLVKLVGNFTNILRPALAPIFFCQKIENENCKHIKATQNTFCTKKLLLGKFTPVVDFANILRVTFAPIFLLAKKLQSQTVIRE